MKQYLLSVCYEPGSTMPAPDALKHIMHDVHAVREDMKKAGVWVFGAGLLPASTATTVRPRGAESVITDGPFAEGREFIGGLTIINAPDLDRALDWGRKLSRATTTAIEVRPFQSDAG